MTHRHTYKLIAEETSFMLTACALTVAGGVGSLVRGPQRRKAASSVAVGLLGAVVFTGVALGDVVSVLSESLCRT